MIGFIGISINFIFGTLLTANGNLKQLSYISLIAIVINLVLNFTLIPEFGAQGAAITMCITQCFVAISQFVLAKIKIAFPIYFRHVLPYIVFICALVGTSYTLKNDPYLLFYQLVVGITGLFVLKFINISELKKAFIPK